MVSRQGVRRERERERERFALLYVIFCHYSVGRITGRLPKELADEVVQSLLEFFRYMHVVVNVDLSWKLVAVAKIKNHFQYVSLV